MPHGGLVEAVSSGYASLTANSERRDRSSIPSACARSASVPALSAAARARLTADAAGGFHGRFMITGQGVSGTGLWSGTAYRVNGPSPNTTFNTSGPPPLVSTFGVNFHIISQGAAPNFLVHILFHVTVNANGEVTALVMDYSPRCTG